MTEAMKRPDLFSESQTAQAAPIDAVLVMEDRAQITRRAKVMLASGRQTLRIREVTPLLCDRTLRCRLRVVEAVQGAAEAPRVLDVQVKRNYVIRAARPEREKELTATIERKVSEYLGEYDQSQASVHQLELLKQASDDLGQHIRDRLFLASFDPSWKEDIIQTWTRRAQMESGLLSSGWLLEDQALAIRRLEAERLLTLQPQVEYQAEILTEVLSGSPAEAILEWEYQVPCALWRPEYTAELLEAGTDAKVRWQSTGTVWQASGEDWKSVELRLSTARPTLGALLPLLVDDVLSTRPKTTEEKKVIEVSSRDETIAKTDTAPEKQTDTPPGLDDGGEARTYLAPKRVDVPSDGRPHRIEFERWEAKAELQYTCLPERALWVFLRSLQKNPSSLPLLAGPVSLVKNGGFIGRSQIGYVATLERFALSWGSEDGLVVMRDLTRKIEEVGLRKHQHHTFEVEVYLANHSTADRMIQLGERLPVSEIEQVEIVMDEKETTKGLQKDSQGLVTWEVELPAGAEKKMRLLFTVQMPQNVRWSG